jgi:phosphatidate phosphatase LPIN
VGSLTREPFGQTEKRHVEHSDVDFLDLNAPSKPTPKDPSGKSGAASDLLNTSNPPNPLEARPGESVERPSRNDKLSHHSLSGKSQDRDPFHSLHDNPDEDLPKVKPGEGEGPKVVYGKDVVLDIAGYHNQVETPLPSDKTSTVFESFTKDLVDALNQVQHAQRPRLTHENLTDSAIPLTAAPQPMPDTASAFQLDVGSTSRFDRGKSEPPPDLDDLERSPPRSGKTLPPSRPLSGLSVAEMDYAWDWGQSQGHSGLSGNVEHDAGRIAKTHARADSMSSLDLAEPHSSARFSHVENNPYLLTLSVPSGSNHAFELALCGDEGYAKDGRASVSASPLKPRALPIISA